MEEFPGLTMDELASMEAMLSMGFRVYTLGDTKAQDDSVCLLHRPLTGVEHIVKVHLEHNHEML